MALKILLFSLIILSLPSCNKEIKNAPELYDDNIETFATGTNGINHFIINSPIQKTPLSYRIYSSGEDPKYDPFEWTLLGSNDSKNWKELDKRSNQTFCSRFQEIEYSISNPQKFDQYLLTVKSKSSDTLIISEFELLTTNKIVSWQNFPYPLINFENNASNTTGSKQYNQLVQNPDKFIGYHARKVAEILFYSDKDTMNEIDKISYELKDYKGISAKSGNPPFVSIVFSTQHIEKSAKESLYKLNYETRGVLYHELTHAYQFEPNGIGTYSTNKTFWACIEGLADAVRAEAGFFEIAKQRKTGGNWLDGYQTTGFFLQWLTSKDPDALKKFHLSVRDLPVWSFDLAMKQIFGPDSGIEPLWNEYQQYLNKQ